MDIIKLGYEIINMLDNDYNNPNLTIQLASYKEALNNLKLDLEADINYENKKIDETMVKINYAVKLRKRKEKLKIVSLLNKETFKNRFFICATSTLSYFIFEHNIKEEAIVLSIILTVFLFTLGSVIEDIINQKNDEVNNSVELFFEDHRDVASIIQTLDLITNASSIRLSCYEEQLRLVNQFILMIDLINNDNFDIKVYKQYFSQSRDKIKTFQYGV